jgi:hypothetical protein
VALRGHPKRYFSKVFAKKDFCNQLDPQKQQTSNLSLIDDVHRWTILNVSEPYKSQRLRQNVLGIGAFELCN